MAKKVTIQQIADYLGISTFVVSRALSGKSGVKDETRDKDLLDRIREKNANLKVSLSYMESVE